MIYKLSDIFDLQMGKTPTRSDLSYWQNGSYDWISISDLNTDRKYISDTKERITTKAVRESGIKKIPANTVIMSFKLSMGKTAITSHDMFSNEAIMAFIDRKVIRINPDYIYYLLHALDWNKRANKAVKGRTVNKKIISQTQVNIPDYQTQLRIVKIMDSTRKRVKIQKDILSKLDTLIKARFVEMFGDLKFDTPVSKYIESLTAGKSLAGKEKCTNKVLNTGAVSYDKFKNDYKYLPSNYVPDENNKVRTGNVLISRMNTQELVGATAYVWEAPENTYLPDRLWRANLKENVNSIFLWQVLIHPLLKLQIQRVSSGTSGSMKNISKSNFLKLKVPDVNEESQNKFASFVQQVNKSKVAIQKSLDETQILFDSLMQKYFS